MYPDCMEKKQNLLCAHLRVHFLKKLNTNLITVCGLSLTKVNVDAFTQRDRLYL